MKLIKWDSNPLLIHGFFEHGQPGEDDHFLDFLVGTLTAFLCHPIVPDGQVTGLIPVRLGGVTKVTLFLKLIFLLFPESPSYQSALIIMMMMMSPTGQGRTVSFVVVLYARHFRHFRHLAPPSVIPWMATPRLLFFIEKPRFSRLRLTVWCCCIFV